MSFPVPRWSGYEMRLSELRRGRSVDRSRSSEEVGRLIGADPQKRLEMAALLEMGLWLRCAVLREADRFPMPGG